MTEVASKQETKTDAAKAQQMVPAKGEEGVVGVGASDAKGVLAPRPSVSSAPLKSTRAGVVIPAGTFGTDFMAKIQKRFTARHTGFGGVVKTIPAYVRMPSGDLIVGRAGAYKYFSKTCRIVRAMSDPETIPECKMEGKLADHQTPIYEAVMRGYFSRERVERGDGVCYLKRRAGKGKSFIGLAFVQDLRTKTLYVVHNETTLGQIAALAARLYPNLRIGQQFGKTKTDGDIVVATMTSLVGESIEYTGADGREVKATPTEYFRRFGFTIIDEVPVMCTKINAMVFMRVQAQYTLAMSATPNARPDGMDKVAFLHFGEPFDGDALVQDVDKAQPVKWDVRVTEYRYAGPKEYTLKILSEAGTVSAPLTINMLLKDPYRTTALIDLTCRLVAEGCTIFIMMERKRAAALYVNQLRARLGANDVFTDDVIQKVIGGTPSYDKTVAASKGRVCCITYGCGGTGLNFPRYDTIIYASPRRNGFGQFIDRVTRLDGDYSKPRRIVFFRDVRTTLTSQYGGFITTLKSLYPDAAIGRTEVDWTSVKLDKTIAEECARLQFKN